MKRGRGRPPEDPARLEARGALRSHPSRYGQPLPKVGGTLRRERYRKSLESRILDLGAQLQSALMNLLRLTLEPGALKAMQGRLDAGEVTLGALVEFESEEYLQFVQVTEGRPGDGWDESVQLARVQQRVTVGSG